MGYSGARGTLIYEKNLKVKISCQTPFKNSSTGIVGGGGGRGVEEEVGHKFDKWFSKKGTFKHLSELFFVQF